MIMEIIREADGEIMLVVGGADIGTGTVDTGVKAHPMTRSILKGREEEGSVKTPYSKRLGIRMIVRMVKITVEVVEVGVPRTPPPTKVEGVLE